MSGNLLTSIVRRPSRAWDAHPPLITGTTSGVLVARGINAPTTQSLLNYTLLTCVCGAIHASQHGWRWPQGRNPWSVYMLLALLDVEANFLVTKVCETPGCHVERVYSNCRGALPLFWAAA